MTTLEITATDDETLVDLPPGDVELRTPHPVVFWCARRDPSVRAGDYRTELQRLHAGVPIQIANVPPGWKLAISLRPDLPAIHKQRPAPPPPPAPPALTAEELEELRIAKQIAKDMERAEIVNEAYDLVMARLAPPAPVDEPPPLLPEPDALMSDYGPVGDKAENDEIVDGFVAKLRDGREVAESTMRDLEAPHRRRLFAILNDDLGRLRNEEALLGKTIPRRAEVEELLGILAQVGEA